MVPIATSPQESQLLRGLLRMLPDIALKLEDPDAWGGIQNKDPESSFQYTRLVCKDVLVPRGRPEREYQVGAHRFETVQASSALHNHRVPFALFPFSDDGRLDLPLYHMPWEHRDGDHTLDSGTMVIHSGQAYAVEGCLDTYHQVHSLRPHLSISLADITEPPARTDRLISAPLTPEAVEDSRRLCLHGLRATLTARGCASQTLLERAVAWFRRGLRP